MFSKHTPRILRITAFAAVTGLAGGGILAYAAGRSAEGGKGGTVTVRVDDTPIERTPGSDISFAPIVSKVMPSVVKIVIRENARDIRLGSGQTPFDDILPWFFGPNNGGDRRTFRQPPREGLGSGVIVSGDGYVLTNNHVVEDADKLTVQLSDGHEYDARVVGTDPNTDIAVIKIDAADLPAITFADSEDVQVGDRVLAIGNPFNFGQTVTTGIVSGKGRQSRELGLQYQDFIQTDAAINPGNSGGALVDMHGRLVGINTAIYSRSGGFQGIGFAIPSHLARQVMDSLVKFGKVTRGYLGVETQSLTPALAEEFGLKDTKGVAIASVQTGTAAEKAGLQPNDVVTGFQGQPVEDASHFALAVAGMPPGSDVTLKIVRDGKEMTLDAKLGTMPQDPELAASDSRSGDDTGVLNGVGVSDLTPQVRREFDIPDRVNGAIVSQVEPDSAAAAAGLTPGDVILDIDGSVVKSADDVVRLTEKSDDYRTRLRIWSRGGTQYLVVDESDGKKD